MAWGVRMFFFQINLKTTCIRFFNAKSKSYTYTHIMKFSLEPLLILPIISNQFCKMYYQYSKTNIPFPRTYRCINFYNKLLILQRLGGQQITYQIYHNILFMIFQLQTIILFKKNISDNQYDIKHYPMFYTNMNRWTIFCNTCIWKFLIKNKNKRTNRIKAY